jgi:hypothetical protein
MTHTEKKLLDELRRKVMIWNNQTDSRKNMHVCYCADNLLEMITDNTKSHLLTNKNNLSVV